MEMEFYVNTDMHVYVYVCVRDDSRDLEAGACFCSSFISWYVRKSVCLIHIWMLFKDVTSKLPQVYNVLPPSRCVGRLRESIFSKSFSRI